MAPTALCSMSGSTLRALAFVRGPRSGSPVLTKQCQSIQVVQLFRRRLEIETAHLGNEAPDPSLHRSLGQPDQVHDRARAVGFIITLQLQGDLDRRIAEHPRLDLNV